MKKQVLSGLLVLCLIFSLLPVSAFADTAKSGTCGDNLTWTLDSEGTLTISGRGAMTDYSNDSKAPWFNSCSSIKSAIIESGVTSIGNYAFSGCSSLKSVTIPDSVTSIGTGVFGGCSSLTSVTIPNSVTSISENAFRYCDSLTSVTIPHGVTSIGDYAFCDCTNLTSITIPESVTSIGYSAFSSCENLTDVYFGGSEEQWNQIDIQLENYNLTNATIHYNSAVTHEHSYTSAVTEPTCTAQGYTTHTCTCGDSYVDSYTDALGHDFGAWTQTKAPTCTAKGTETRTCTRCNATETRDVEALGHNTTHHAAKAATCTEAGWEAYDTCSRCDYTTYKEIPATGHHHDAVVTAPTCTEKGYTTHTCACGDSHVDSYTDALGHSYKNGKCVRCNAADPTYIAAPTLKITTSAGKPQISWNAVDGATKYWIYRSTDGKTFKYYDSTTKTSYTNKSTSIGTTYYYKVKAVKTVDGTNYTSDLSGAKSIMCKPAAPTVSIYRTNGKPQLKWSAVTGATKYWIYRSTDGKTFKYYDSTTKTSYTNSGAASGKKYYYRVKAVAVVNGTNVTSANSNTKSLMTTLAKPTVSITTSNGKPKITWKAVTGADKYYVYRSTDGKNFSYYDSTTKLSYTNTGAKKGTKYYYKVKAICSANTNANSAYSAVVSIKATK